MEKIKNPRKSAITLWQKVDHYREKKACCKAGPASDGLFSLHAWFCVRF